jgi:hypothetical protein
MLFVRLRSPSHLPLTTTTTTAIIHTQPPNLEQPRPRQRRAHEPVEVARRRVHVGRRVAAFFVACAYACRFLDLCCVRERQAKRKAAAAAAVMHPTTHTTHRAGRPRLNGSAAQARDHATCRAAAAAAEGLCCVRRGAGAAKSADVRARVVWASAGACTACCFCWCEYAYIRTRHTLLRPLLYTYKLCLGRKAHAYHPIHLTPLPTHATHRPQPKLERLPHRCCSRGALSYKCLRRSAKSLARFRRSFCYDVVYIN